MIPYIDGHVLAFETFFFGFCDMRFLLFITQSTGWEVGNSILVSKEH